MEHCHLACWSNSSALKWILSYSKNQTRRLSALSFKSSMTVLQYSTSNYGIMFKWFSISGMLFICALPILGVFLLLITVGIDVKYIWHWKADEKSNLSMLQACLFSLCFVKYLTLYHFTLPWGSLEANILSFLVHVCTSVSVEATVDLGIQVQS